MNVFLLQLGLEIFFGIGYCTFHEAVVLRIDTLDGSVPSNVTAGKKTRAAHAQNLIGLGLLLGGREEENLFEDLKER